MSIYKEYLFYQNKFEQKYGKYNTIVFMQIGSFHEAYSTDTEGFNLFELENLLSIKCTKKNTKISKVDEHNPYLLGFPSVALVKYLTVLVDNGFTVAVVDQVTPPPKPKREVTGVYSPGTYDSPNSVSYNSNNIVSLYIVEEPQKNGSPLICVGMSAVDLTTGHTVVNEAHSVHNDDKYGLDEGSRFIVNYDPKEILIMNCSSMNKNSIITYLELESKEQFVFYKEKIDKKYTKLSYQEEFLSKIYPKGVSSTVEHIGIERKPYGTVSFIVNLDFAYQHNSNIINSLFTPTVVNGSKHLILGNNALYQLNIVENNTVEKFNKKFKSLIDVVDNTSTPVGARCLRSYIVHPITDVKELQMRYNYTQYMIKDTACFESVEKYLKSVGDVEKMNRRLALCKIEPYELPNLTDSCRSVSKIINVLKKSRIVKQCIPDKECCIKLTEFIKKIGSIFDTEELKKYSSNSNDTSFFKKGVFPEIDELQDKISRYKKFMDNICSSLSKYITDKDETVVHLNSNGRDGYYLKLTKIRATKLKKALSKIKSVKITDDTEVSVDSIIFKDNVAGTTKIFIDKLSESSDSLSVVSEKISQTVQKRYIETLKNLHTNFYETVKRVSEFVGFIDFIKSNAKTAKMYNYVKPKIVQNVDKGFIDAEQLRHPIIERIRNDVEYVPHDIVLGKPDKVSQVDCLLVYGLNSAGKSSFMKAVGLSVVMAQAGMFVPALKYEFSPYESVFARITGNDNLFKGLSSYALEMYELKAILRRAGAKTLVIGDEVCRGTEHVSGNAIVASTVINLVKTRSSSIFATHLHEIANMERIKQIDSVKAVHLTVEYDDTTGKLVFDRKLKEGSGPKVYGITVAQQIIDNTEFIMLAQDIKHELLEQHNTVLNDKTSRYNSDVYMNSCTVCGKNTQLDTHHINFQKDCTNGFINSKPHLKKDEKYNLVTLCKKCHNNVHNGNLTITKYSDTSNGPEINYEYV